MPSGSTESLPASPAAPAELAHEIGDAEDDGTGNLYGEIPRHGGEVDRDGVGVNTAKLVTRSAADIPFRCHHISEVGAENFAQRRRLDHLIRGFWRISFE